MLCAYGKYADELVLQNASGENIENVPGVSGSWRIRSRIVGFTQRIGDEKIMSEF